ncbi:hypothetical protein BDR06DRAFT_1001742 [Suillus hirtellus]|nr:hypothetical protein BDR06DRAFT_1001742 [Suillus hirtellus]
MSTTCYQTQSHACHVPNDHSTPNAKAAMLPCANSESSLSTVSAPPGEAMPRAPSPAYSVDTPICLYSDVVLTCIPSMPGALEATPVGAMKPIGPKPRKQALARADTVETTPVSTEVSREENRKSRVTFDLHDESGDDQHSEWTTVEGKHGRKIPSCEASEERRGLSELSQEQEHLVKLAENKLTETDRKTIEARQCTLNLNRESNESRGEGTSWDKEDSLIAGTPDQGEYVPHARAESTVKSIKERVSKQYEARIQALEAQLALREDSGRRKARKKASNPVDGMVDWVLERASSPPPSRCTPQAMEPIQQVAPRSYIGQALGRLKTSNKSKSKKTKRKKKHTSRDPSDDEDPSESSSSSSPSESSSKSAVDEES